MALLGVPASGQEEPLLREYRQRLAALEATYGNVEMVGRFRDETGNPVDGNFKENARLELFRRGDEELVRAAPIGPDGRPSAGRGEVVYRGPEICFRLLRRDGDYLVDYLGEDRKKVQQFNFHGGSLGAATSVFGVPVREMLDAPGFQLKEARRVLVEGQERIRFEFRYDYRSEKDKPIFREGWWTVDPTIGWPVCEYEFGGSGVASQAPIVGRSEYRADRRGRPMLVRDGFEWRPEGSWVIRSFEVESCRFGSCPDRPFRLGTYGLGHLEKRGAVPTWMGVFGLLSAACLFCGFAARRASARRRRSEVVHELVS